MVPSPPAAGVMTWSLSAARNLIARCSQLRNDHRNEAVLRAEFQSWLRRVFSSTADEAWVNHYSEGAEARTTIGTAGGATANRFIDTLIRATVIEYEADLRHQPVRDHGQQQVREYIAGAVRAGQPISQVRGVLSDTVEWYVFEGRLRPGASPTACTPDDIELQEIEALVPTAVDDENANRLGAFLKKHLAREQSRPLSAAHITGDLGLDSLPFGRHVNALLAVVTEGRAADSSIALATELWSRFVDSLEQPRGTFRAEMYVDELYIAVLARLLAANVLNGRAMLSDDTELAEILNGYHFLTRFRLKNMVEDDYFGWVVDEPHLTGLLLVAREIQSDLYAYDFSQIIEEDLFGRLMAQLARRSQRKLLGQEWTPTWLGHELARRCLAGIPAGDAPRIIDMCCGSGSILAEILKEDRRRRNGVGLEGLATVATGFDIDPLAVMLAKTTWVVTLVPLIQNATEDIIIPIYHADSLFATTPVSTEVPAPGEPRDFVIDLDGEAVTLPSELIAPDLRALFDDIVDWAYDEARAGEDVAAKRATELVDALIGKHRVTMATALRSKVAGATLALATRLVELARANRNGIWAFILRNTYRPGLLVGQFNGLVSNPPWLAMSQLAENPYQAQLSARALLYGINPAGASHLHLELATTYLLHAVDRYLSPGAAVACLLPGTIFNGHHHQKFRDAAYLASPRSVAFELDEVWEVAAGTFKVRSAAVVGTKRATPIDVHSEPSGFHMSVAGLAQVSFEVRHLGTRTAWVLAGDAAPLGAPADEPVPPQGADLMPRTAVCVDVMERTGAEWKVGTPSIGAAKKLRHKKFPGFVAPQFLFRMVQSQNLLPFVCAEPFAIIALPARRAAGGDWETLDAAAIRALGFRHTATRFGRIDEALVEGGVVRPLAEKINERNKLSLQRFPPDHHLVLTGAGGGISCAACLPVNGHEDIVIDQTLYWRLVASAAEAWYRVGLLNSDAITEAIRLFNPQGEFGERHLHTLPHRVLPAFDPSNEDHRRIAWLSERLAVRVGAIIGADPRIADRQKAIASRRTRVREQLRALPEFQELEEICAAVLGTTPGAPAA